jgi:hypothetical protein
VLFQLLMIMKGEEGMLKKLEAQGFIRTRTCGQCPSTGAIGHRESKKQSDLVSAPASNPRDGEGVVKIRRSERAMDRFLYCDM